jgi:NADH-quinone oxidoreductase subunit J
MALTWLFFIGIGLVIVITAAGVVLMRNAIYAALFLVANFSMVAVLYLILGAPFIAMAQVTVYAGAIMVLFLFVIMLLGAEKLPFTRNLPAQRPVALVLGAIALVEITTFVVWRFGAIVPVGDHPAEYASPAAVGKLLFTDYALPFEVTSIILLVALVGAVVLTRSEELGIRSRLLGERRPPVRTTKPDNKE